MIHVASRSQRRSGQQSRVLLQLCRRRRRSPSSGAGSARSRARRSRCSRRPSACRGWSRPSPACPVRERRSGGRFERAQVGRSFLRRGECSGDGRTRPTPYRPRRATSPRPRRGRARPAVRPRPARGGRERRSAAARGRRARRGPAARGARSPPRAVCGAPGRVATPSRAELEHALGLLPGREVEQLVGADQEDGSSRASASSESTVRP